MSLTDTQRKYAQELAEALVLKWLSRPLDEQLEPHVALLWCRAALEKFGDFVISGKRG
jgi:hypothetical protein